MGAMAAGGRGTSANSRRWRDESSPSRLAGGDDDGGGGGGGVGGQQYFHADPHPHAYNHLHRHSRHATLAARQRHQHQHQQQQRQRPTGGRFRKETQDKVCLMSQGAFFLCVFLFSCGELPADGFFVVV